jgi:hypothetical protein
VNVGSSGCSDIEVINNLFDGVNYGVLTNSSGTTGAHDLENVKVNFNRFVNIQGDAIEFNHPATPPAAANTFHAMGNYIEVPDRAGAPTTSGFGIGIAGVKSGSVSLNHIATTRYHGIHLEDECSDWVIDNNIVDEAVGTLAGISTSLNVGVSIGASDRIRVSANNIRGSVGYGIQTIYDGVTANNRDVTVTGNDVSGCGISGIYLGGNSTAGRIVATNNNSSNNTGDGFTVAGDFNELLFDNNIAIGNGGWGVNRSGQDAGQLRVFGDNLVYGNTLGDVKGIAISAGSTAVVRRRAASGSGTTGGDSIYNASLFRLGSFARGRVVITTSRSNGRHERVYDVSWDGTTLNVKSIKSSAFGLITVALTQMTDGVLTARISGGAASLAVGYAATFEGICVEDATVYSGTVTATVAANTDDLKDSLIAGGLLLSGGATPLDLDGGALTAGAASLSSLTVGGVGVVRKGDLVVNIKDYGAVGNGSTDDTVAIQTAMDAAWALKARLFIPPTSSFYKTSKGILHRSGVHVFGSGEASHIKNVGNGGTNNYDTAMTWMWGTYGPGNGSTATQNEQGYSIQDTTAGVWSVTLDTAGDASNFAVGDLIAYEGGTSGDGLHPNTPNGIGVIRSISGGTLTLTDAIEVALITVDVSPVIRKLNTGLVAGSGHTQATAPWSTSTAYVLQDASVEDVWLESTIAGYQPISASAYGCSMRNVRLTSNHSLLAADPMAYCRFENVYGEYQSLIADMAYESHDTVFENCRFVRTGTSVVMLGQPTFWVNDGEGGRTIICRDCIIEDSSTTVDNLATVFLRAGSVWSGGSVASTRGGAAIDVGSDSTSDGALIVNTAGDGILVNGSRSVVTRNRVRNTPSGKYAIHLGPSATEYVVADNICGTPTRNIQDVVHLDNGGSLLTGTNGGVVHDNTTYYSKPRFRSCFPSSLTGSTSETTKGSITYITRGAITTGQGFYIRHHGTASGSGGTKTVKIKFGGGATTTLLTVSIPSGTTQFSIEGTVTFGNGTTWYGDWVINVGGAVTTQTGTFTADPTQVDTVQATHQLASSGDTVTQYLFDVEPLVDGSTSQ